LGLAIFWFIVFLAIFPFHFPTLVLFLSPLILALGFINIFIMHEKCWGWDIIGAIFILLAIFVVIDSSILNYCRTIFYILAACFSFFWIVILPFTIKKTEVPASGIMAKLEEEAILFVKNNNKYKRLSLKDQEDLAKIKARIAKKEYDNLILLRLPEYDAWQRAIKTMIHENNTDLEH
jgi:hypothetical protein